jgi:biopolymer transport protein ExbD
MAFRRRQRHLPEIPIIPMIDTMFFLLVFFILTSLNVIKLEGINVNLPDAKNPNQQTKAIDLTVTVTPDKKVLVNGKDVTGQDIGPILISTLNKSGKPYDLTKQSVVINADGQVPYSLVIQCIDQARGAKLTKFAMATTTPKEGGVTQP